jgi:hypothetical protein
MVRGITEQMRQMSQKQAIGEKGYRGKREEEAGVSREWGNTAAAGIRDIIKVAKRRESGGPPACGNSVTRR